MASIKEISNITGVSPATVSRILNNDQSFSVSHQVRLDVIKCASELGYQTPRAKKKFGKTFIVGIVDWHVVPSGMLPGYDMRFSKSRDNPIDIRFVRLNKNEVKEVSGVIAIGTFNEEEMNHIMLCSPNVVIINSLKKPDYSHNRLIVDLNIAWSKAIEYLTSFTNKIGYIGGEYNDDDLKIGELSNRVMKQKLEELGLYKKELFFTGRLTEYDGSSLLRAAIHNGAEAIIVSSQLIEKGVISEYEKLNLNIPIVLTRDMPFDIGAVDNQFPKVRMYPNDLWFMAIDILIAHARKPKLNVNACVPTIFEVPNR